MTIMKTWVVREGEDTAVWNRGVGVADEVRAVEVGPDRA
jgi:hypothetical protein